MKYFTQYLYEYQKEKRTRNIGFVKAEQGKMSGSFQIQARGVEVKSEEGFGVYLFYQKDGDYESVFQGKIPKKSPMINYTLEFTKEDIGNADSIEDIAGLMLMDTNGKRYAAIWNGDHVNVDEIREMSKKQTKEVVMDIPQIKEEITPAIEIPVSAAETKQINIAPEQKNICEKIQRKDLARLPRKDWRLANNNFLLHGFYNYHHLLWIEEGKELYIGVPGVYHAREVQAARAFGFTKFRPVEETGIDLEEEEQNQREDFGYFCRRIVRNE